MNILMCCYEYPPLGGGGGRVVAGLLHQLTRMTHSVDLVTMQYKGLPAIEIKDGFSVNRVACFRNSPILCSSHEMLSYLCMAFPAAMKLAHKKSYDLIHAHFIFPDGVLAYLVSKRTGLPYVITAHGSDVPGYNPDRFIRQHKVLFPFWKGIVRNSSRTICLSRFLENLLKRKFPDARTTVIPNGFDTGKFTPERPKTDRILIVSRLFKRKGIQHIIKAMDGIAPESEVHVVGDGPYLNELKAQARRVSAQIKFHGYLDNDSREFADLLETSRIFALPSESENFPVSLLEAMAAGMAIITTRGTGCEEVVGDTALLVNPGDVGALRDSLVKLLEDPLLCSRLGSAAKRRLDAHFGWESVARSYAAIYDEIV